MPNECTGVYCPENMSLERFVKIYVSGPGEGYANGETAASVKYYLDETVKRIGRYLALPDTQPTPGTTPPPSSLPQGYTAHQVPGLGAPLILPSDIGFRINLTPMGVTGRKGWDLQPPFQVTRHTTNNPNPGTNAWQHSGWQKRGAPGNEGIAVHAYSDDKEVVITVPWDEQGVHSGDWRNDQSVALELTRHEGINRARAEEIAIALDAAALHARGLNVDDNLYPHTHNAEGHCPDLSMSWPEYERRVNVALQKLKG